MVGQMEFYFRSLLLGVGLAMDAVAVSIANGFKYPNLKKSFWIFMCILFGIFQGAMPFIGYIIGYSFFSFIVEYIPWLALILLCFLGINMIFSVPNDENNKNEGFKMKSIFLQAIATSIDALTVGFTFVDYPLFNASICVGIIALVTFLLCMIGIGLGKKFGLKYGYKAEWIGGFILIGIGIEIFLKGMGLL